MGAADDQGIFGGWKNMRREFTPMLAFVAIFGTAGSMTFAYDAGWWGACLSNTAFIHFYGELTDPKTNLPKMSASQQSYGTGLGVAGTMIGCMIAGWAARTLGRRNSMFLLACIGLLGALIELTSVLGPSSRSRSSHYWQLVVGKMVVNSSVGIATTVIPSYLSEVSPTKIRAFMVTCHSLAEGIGGILAGGTVLGSQLYTNKLPWMLPIGLQMFIPLLMILGSRLLPESPRWLVEMGREEEAVQAMARLRTGYHDYRPAEEVAAIKQAIEHHEEVQAGTSFKHLFVGSNRRRTMITVAMTCLQQGMGISFINNYLAVTLVAIGIARPVKFTLGLSAAQFITMITVMSFAPDRFGRRPLLMLGAFIMGGCLFTVGGISAATHNQPSHTLQNVSVAMYFLWAIAFSVSWGPLSWTTMAETPSAALKEKTMALGAWAGFGVGMTVNFVQPYLAAAMGSRSAFIYASFTVPSFFFTYFLIPELKGRSLEQIDELFDMRISARKSRSYICRTAAADLLDEATPEQQQAVEEYEKAHNFQEIEQVDQKTKA